MFRVLDMSYPQAVIQVVTCVEQEKLGTKISRERIEMEFSKMLQGKQNFIRSVLARTAHIYRASPRDGAITNI